MDSSTEKNSAGAICEFTQNLEILRQIEFFAGLPMETLKVFAYLLEREAFNAGDYLYHQDDEEGRAFYILKGGLCLVRHIDGQEQMVRHLDEGEFIGGLSLLSPMRHLYSLKAERDTVCLVLTREKFSRAIAQFPELVPRIFKSVADSIRNWDRQRLFEITEKGLILEDMVGISAI